MCDSPWLLGPQFLLKSEEPHSVTPFSLVNPDEDKEVRPNVNELKSEVSAKSSFGSHRFERFSLWKRLVEAIALLQQYVASYRKQNASERESHKTVKAFKQAECFILKEIQGEQLSEELLCIKESKQLPRSSPLLTLNPFIDHEGILRVGGRLNRA